MGLWATLMGCAGRGPASAQVQEGDLRALAALVGRSSLSADQLVDLPDSDGVTVSVAGGRVVRLAVAAGGRLDHPRSLARLEGLEELQLVGVELSEWQLPASLRTLRVARATAVDWASVPPTVDHLAITEQTSLELAQLAGATGLSQLHVSQTPVSGLAALAGHPHLRSLTVKSAGLQSLAGLDALPRLVSLDVSHNALVDFRDLGLALPVWAELDASHNALRSAAHLDAYPTLVDVDLRHNQLHTFPGVALAGVGPKITDNPGADTWFAAQQRRRQQAAVEARRAELPTDHRAVRPPTQGRVVRARVSRGHAGSRVFGSATYGRVHGLMWVELASLDPTDVLAPERRPEPVRVEVSVGSGTLRVWLAETEAGHPTRDVVGGASTVVRGRLGGGTHGVGLWLEAVDGPAADVTLQVRPTRD